MPIYEYQCQECAHKLEKLQRMSDAPLTDCPACGRPALKRLVSAAGFRLKGGGWYETDFKQGNQRNLAGGEAEAKAGDAGKSEAKGDAKGAAKTDGAGEKKASDGGKVEATKKSGAGAKAAGKGAGKPSATA